MTTDRVKCALLFIPAIFATTAFILSLAGNVYCSTIHFPPTHQMSNEPVLSLGVFYYHTVSLVPGGSASNSQSSCSSYPSSTHFDAKWRTAKAFSIMAPVIGGFCLFWTWMAPCWRPSKQRWRRGGMIYLVCGVFEALTLIFLASNACRDNPGITLLGGGLAIDSYSHHCELGPGSKMNIVSILCWLILGVALLVVPPPEPWPIPPVETQTVTYQQTTNPDGTVTVTETNIVKKTLPNDNIKNLDEIAAAPV